MTLQMLVGVILYELFVQAGPTAKIYMPKAWQLKIYTVECQLS